MQKIQYTMSFIYDEILDYIFDVDDHDDSDDDDLSFND